MSEREFNMDPSNDPFADLDFGPGIPDFVDTNDLPYDPGPQPDSGESKFQFAPDGSAISKRPATAKEFMDFILKAKNMPGDGPITLEYLKNLQTKLKATIHNLVMPEAEKMKEVLLLIESGERNENVEKIINAKTFSQVVEDGDGNEVREEDLSQDAGFLVWLSSSARMLDKSELEIKKDSAYGVAIRILIVSKAIDGSRACQLLTERGCVTEAIGSLFRHLCTLDKIIEHMETNNLTVLFPKRGSNEEDTNK